MKYRKFGKLEFQVSALGFGCMRLPVKDKPDNIDEHGATEILQFAIDQGVNYIDTAYTYHGGNSERLVGNALKSGYREKVMLATKMPCWLIKDYNDFDRYLDEQLERLQTGHIDFYLLHGLHRKQWHKILDKDVFGWSEKAMTDGRINHLGFSFHDSYDVFKDIVDAYDNWSFCQIQYNYMNEDVQAGTMGLKYAAEKGLAVVIMEPLLGGFLTKPPDDVQSIWDTAEKTINPTDMAFQWLWNKPEISVVLSGMNTMEQVRQNLKSAGKSGIDTMTQENFDLIARVHAKYKESTPIPCTKCGYCMPCPNDIDIPRNFELYSEGIIYKNMRLSKIFYNEFMAKIHRAGACIACKSCEELCPQHIEISSWMSRVDEALFKKE